MCENASSDYAHTQRGALHLLVGVSAVPMLVAAWFVRDQWPLNAILAVSGVLMVVTAAAFGQLSVADQGERLGIHFGPLPLFWKTIPYATIERAEQGRTLLLDGWGIHLSLRGGWVWNLWGRDCVVVQTSRGVIRIGTDDPAGLCEFLQRKIDERGAAV